MDNERALEERWARLLWSEYMRQLGHPSGLPTWDEMIHAPDFWRDEIRRFEGYANAIQQAFAQDHAALIAERDALRVALRSLLAVGPEHDLYCAIGSIHNCTCDLHPARQYARQALQTGGDDAK